MSDKIIASLQRGLGFGGCVLSAESCKELLDHITAWQSCVKDNNKGVTQITERVIAFASQLEAWGYDTVAFDMLTEILGGEVNAPDYYALRAELAASQAASNKRGEIAQEYYLRICNMEGELAGTQLERNASQAEVERLRGIVTPGMKLCRVCQKESNMQLVGYIFRCNECDKETLKYNQPLKDCFQQGGAQ